MAGVIWALWLFSLQINSTAESVFRERVDALLWDAGCESQASCLVTVSLGDPVNGPTNWLPLTTLKEAQGLQRSNVQVKTTGLYNVLLAINLVQWLILWSLTSVAKL